MGSRTSGRLVSGQAVKSNSRCTVYLAKRIGWILMIIQSTQSANQLQLNVVPVFQIELVSM